jgi:hypothetical protein
MPDLIQSASLAGVQVFFRGKIAIRRLTEIVNSGLLIAGTGSNTESAVILFNRIQQLREQRKQLQVKQGLISVDSDLRNAISAVDGEISYVQGELTKLARNTSWRDK